MVEEPQGAQEGILHCVACAVFVSQQPARKVICGIEMRHHQCLELPCFLTQCHCVAANSSKSAIVFLSMFFFSGAIADGFSSSVETIDVIPSVIQIYSRIFFVIG